MYSWMGFNDVNAFFVDWVRNIQEFDTQAQVPVHASGERAGADSCRCCGLHAPERRFCRYVGVQTYNVRLVT
jgi:hypothetical protein